VMQAPGGWGDKCEIHFAKGTVEEGHTSYNSVDDCFRQNADAINTDVGRMTTLIQNYNNEVSQLEMEGGFVESVGFLGVKNINSGKSANARLEGLIEEFSDGGSITFGEETINFEEFAETEGIENAYNYGYISNSQLQNIVINKRILESEDASQILEEGARQSLFEDLKSVKEGLESEAGKSQLIEALQDKISGEILIDNYAESGRIRALYRGGKYNGGISGIEVEDRNIQIVNFGNVKYAFILGDEDGGDYNIEGIYELDNVGKVGTNLKTRFDGLGPSESLSPADKDFAERYKVLKKFNFEKLDAASYQNVFVKPEVRYFETEPFKGMPAVVPFDLREGWYVATRQSLAIFDGGGAFESSGRAAVFWLCNVGKNGKVDFDRTGFGDDECRQFNAAADQPPDFQGLSKQKSVRLVQRAMKALQDASSQYSIGRTHIGIEGDQIPIGNPAVNVPSTRCQDFMSPEECHLLFNVCDPVICPSSRCDLGGKYPVSDIVQSGVVGSIALCLPNVKEGIFIPVCLTGIHAGLESWVSILKSHRDCLQHNVETGQYVGICDEITSIYMCEFFWRQLAPIVDVLIPRLVEIAYGQGVRGGGEYLTVMAAWNNMQASINQFTQNYAVNSLNAFKVRNVQEAGGQFCKAFISAKAPTAFESLIEPDSPSQFYAWFDSIPFTDATVPATSQYKVYYHIFAGNDQGVQYSVFLKNPPELSFFAIPEIVHVASGFVPRGESADETVDFTAPDGYKELCVRINDKEECGFRQVTTSFGLNFVRDKFVSEELQRADISTEDECIGGSPGFGALLNPNLQSGVEELVSPEVYNRGVVRICSTSNPGSQTEPTRFVKVGSCDNERVGCWLDKKSFDNALTDSNKLLRNATISELEEVQLESSGFLADDSGEFISKIKEFNDAKEKLKKSFGESQGIGKESSLESRIDILTGEIGQLFDKLFINWHKAQATFILAEVYEIGARALKPGSVEKISAQVEDKEREVLVEGDFEINGDIVIINEGKVKELSSEDKIIEFAAGEFAKNLGAGWSVRTINKDEGLVLFYKKEDSDSMYFMISSDSEKKIVEFSDAPFTGVDLGSGIEDFEFYSNGGRVSRISLFDDVLLRVSHNCDSVGLLVTHSRTSFNIDEVVIVDKDYEITPDSGRYTAKADCKINGEIVSSEERQLIVEEVLGN
jgi:hypothetical protein